MKIRVLVVDDHSLIRDGLRFLIDAEPDMTVVGQASDGAGALKAAAALGPDVVVMDIEMPGGSGIDVARQILAEAPATRVVMLSAYPDPAYVTESVRAGASGYLIKGNASAEVLHAIRAVVKGHTFMSPEATSALVTSFKSQLGEGAGTKPTLSPREREVLIMVADGLRTKEIASRLNIGTKTVDTHRARLMKKLKCSSTAELVRYAIREGLTE